MGASGAASHGRREARSQQGHRGDLKQLLLILTVSADGAVPLAHRCGRRRDRRSDAHRDVDGLCVLVGRHDFLYVADSKLSRAADGPHRAPRRTVHHGVPRSRSEEGRLREWMSTQAPDRVEACRRPGKRNGDPDLVSAALPGAVPDHGGIPHHLGALKRQTAPRRERPRRADRPRRPRPRGAIGALGRPARQDHHPRRRRGGRRRAADHKRRRALGRSRSSRPLRSATARRNAADRQQHRYRKIAKTRYALEVSVDAEQVRYDAASDGRSRSRPTTRS